MNTGIHHSDTGTGAALEKTLTATEAVCLLETALDAQSLTLEFQAMKGFSDLLKNSARQFKISPGFGILSMKVHRKSTSDIKQIHKPTKTAP